MSDHKQDQPDKLGGKLTRAARKRLAEVDPEHEKFEVLEGPSRPGKKAKVKLPDPTNLLDLPHHCAQFHEDYICNHSIFGTCDEALQRWLQHWFPDTRFERFTIGEMICLDCKTNPKYSLILSHPTLYQHTQGPNHIKAVARRKGESSHENRDDFSAKAKAETAAVMRTPDTRQPEPHPLSEPHPNLPQVIKPRQYPSRLSLPERSNPFQSPPVVTPQHGSQHFMNAEEEIDILQDRVSGLEIAMKKERALLASCLAWISEQKKNSSAEEKDTDSLILHVVCERISEAVRNNSKMDQDTLLRFINVISKNPKSKAGPTGSDEELVVSIRDFLVLEE